MLNKIFIIFLTTISINFLSAMPPHPKTIQEYEENGLLPLLSRQMIIDKQIGKNQAINSFPTTGTRKVLVLVIGYSNEILTTTNPETFYYELFTNGPDIKGLSWKKYYQDMSNNKLILEFDVYEVGSAAQSHDYYGNNSTGTPGDDDFPALLVSEAITAGENLSTSINYAQYDNDGDGEVDAVIVIHQGKGEEYFSSTATDIWSHRWNLSSAKAANNDGPGALTYDGVIINNYAIQPEYLDSAGDSTIGVFVHEFGHILGLPDLYDTSYASDGIGQWAIMSGGSWLGPNGKGAQPAPMTAWSRAQLGWLTVDTVSAKVIYPFSSGHIKKLLLLILMAGLFLILIPEQINKKKPRKWVLLSIILISLIPLSTCKKDSEASLVSIDLADIEISYKAEKININSNEYLLVENKAKINDTWTEYLPGQGLTVYHIDNNLITERYSTNSINDFSINGQLGIKMVEADSGSDLLDPDDGDYGSATDPFYFGNVDSILNYTANSGETANFEITNISGLGSVISFNILSY